MQTMEVADIERIVASLPEGVRNLLQQHGPTLVLAGGYIRAMIGNEQVSDIDLFCSTPELADQLANAKGGLGVYKSDLAYSTKLGDWPVQYIYSFPFTVPQDVIKTFDFTQSKAAIWWNGATWCACQDPDFMRAVKEKELIYTGANLTGQQKYRSVKRALKFARRGYRMADMEIAKLIQSFAPEVDIGEIHQSITSNYSRPTTVECPVGEAA